jgi:hypothetical protein
VHILKEASVAKFFGRLIFAKKPIRFGHFSKTLTPYEDKSE